MQLTGIQNSHMAHKVAASQPQEPTSCPPSSREAKFELSLKLWKPFSIAACYLGFLRLSGQYAFTAPSDPFSTCWWQLPAVASALYLLTVFFGPQLMADRKPFVIQDYMFTYNIYQTVLNLWCLVAMLAEVRNAGMSVWGNSMEHSPKGWRMGFLVWVHYNNKYVELLDTVFMILRKKTKQMSFLHVYHHVMLIWAWFLVVKVAAGGDSYFGASCNSFVHVVMYMYYLMSSLGVPCPWKKNITQLQMLQFLACLAHSLYVLYYQNMPAVLAYVQLWVMVNMLVLFGQFYWQSYKTPKSSKAKKNK